MLSYQGCQVRTIHWLYWNIWSSSGVIVILMYSRVVTSYRNSAYSGTSGSFFLKHENVVFNGEQKNEQLVV